MSNPLQESNYYRSRMSEHLLSEASTTLKHIFNLGQSTFQKGELNLATKELLAPGASSVIQCDDCIKYHFGCHEKKLTKKAVKEALEIATAVGESIIIPHLRNDYEYREQIELNTK